MKTKQESCKGLEMGEDALERRGCRVRYAVIEEMLANYALKHGLQIWGKSDVGEGNVMPNTNYA